MRDSSVVVTRTAGSTWALPATSRDDPAASLSGEVSELSLQSDREVVYARPGFAGVFDVADGTRRELESGGGPVAVTSVAFVAGGPGGLASWGYERKRRRSSVRSRPARSRSATPNSSASPTGSTRPERRARP